VAPGAKTCEYSAHTRNHPAPQIRPDASTPFLLSRAREIGAPLPLFPPRGLLPAPRPPAACPLRWRWTPAAAWRCRPRSTGRARPPGARRPRTTRWCRSRWAGGGSQPRVSCCSKLADSLMLWEYQISLCLFCLHTLDGAVGKKVLCELMLSRLAVGRSSWLMPQDDAV
jgi:hypothetical protein